MRSRYAAYVLGLEDYLAETWAPETRPATLDLEEAPKPKWIGLEIRSAREDGDTATVEFVARYRVGGRAQRLHETSRFERRDGCWLYVDGTLHDA
ncbi:YchJ family protein [Niveibacterium umoris]|uniref:SEC-C motif-containing protein n=1 Tax=Niveibacterium umoris TaxID=1193620 RepID=A0A840BJR8_9RHOO|nr:YchJ family metal-binding protein [Niveibacterium umoris]MBB4011852.1 SEC-C motif-containing protein [Niveibacterium umoris]